MEARINGHNISNTLIPSGKYLKDEKELRLGHVIDHHGLDDFSD